MKLAIHHPRKTLRDLYQVAHNFNPFSLGASLGVPQTAALSLSQLFWYTGQFTPEELIPLDAVLCTTRVPFWSDHFRPGLHGIGQGVCTGRTLAGT